MAASKHSVIPLINANLAALAQIKGQYTLHNTVPDKLPFYDRSVSSFHGIICHIGVGAFHRSHEEVFTHELLIDQMEGVCDSSERWGIVGIGLRGTATRDILSEQDYLYSVVGRDESEEPTVTVVGSLVDMVLTGDDPEGNAAIERLANPKTRIVSLTLTENGYHVNMATRELNVEEPSVAHDLKQPHEAPKSAVGLIAKALALRRLRGLRPFTILSCDNLPGNGDLTRTMVIGFLKATGDEELVAWTDRHCAFPNSMVDRITPATSARRKSRSAPRNDVGTRSDELRSLLRDVTGIDDSWPILSEKYKQWVIEDNFVSGRPLWEARGATMTDDVQPFEVMKLRMLNAGHSALSYLGYLLGFRYVDCEMGKCGTGWSRVKSPCKKAPVEQSNLSEADSNDNPMPQFLNIFLDEQLATVPPVPGIDLEDYKNTLLWRFSNPRIQDTLYRLAQDGSLKLVTTMKDSALVNAVAGRSVDAFATVVAAWVRFLVGVGEDGEPIEIQDPRAEELQSMARQLMRFPEGGIVTKTGIAMPGDGAVLAFVSCPHHEADVAIFLGNVFGEELAANKNIVAAVFSSLKCVASTSTRDLLSYLIATKSGQN